ncbi:MAG TPA: hypothetical protein VHC41_10705, partial [Mycobacteriales bacterium]|nr:hypothetical protein [Mycobacteriales bacterium]
MPVDVGFAHASDRLLFAAVLVYALAVLGYAFAFAFGRAGRAAIRAEQDAALRTEAALRRTAGPAAARAAAAQSRVLVGAGAPFDTAGPGSAEPAGPVFADGSTLTAQD